MHPLGRFHIKEHILSEIKDIVHACLPVQQLDEGTAYLLEREI